MPAEVKVLGWRKGERTGMVVRGAGGPGSQVGGGTIRIGGRVPWGAKVEYAYRAGYDGRGRLSVTHVVEQGYSAMETQGETPDRVSPCVSMHAASPRISVRRSVRVCSL